jgi:YidC/Oxa1 family membrane protein insertase
MISSIFHVIIYAPLYNALVYLVSLVPNNDVGIAIIILTIIVRIILFPLSRKAIETQIAMKRIAPEVTKLRDIYKEDKTAETKAILELYKANNVHPFASFGIVLLQLPILLGLYFVFARAGFPVINTNFLYSFVALPKVVNMEFLGIWNMAQNHNIFLAVTAGLTQLTYTRLSMGPRGVKTATEASLSDEMAKSFDIQARFVLPLIIAVAGYTLVSAAALYYTASNLCMIIQELLSGRRFTNL